MHIYPPEKMSFIEKKVAHFIAHTNFIPYIPYYLELPILVRLDYNFYHLSVVFTNQEGRYGVRIGVGRLAEDDLIFSYSHSLSYYRYSSPFFYVPFNQMTPLTPNQSEEAFQHVGLKMAHFLSTNDVFASIDSPSFPSSLSQLIQRFLNNTFSNTVIKFDARESYLDTFSFHSSMAPRSLL